MKKVLVVEDSEESRLVVSRALTSSEISLFITDSKKGLVDLISKHDACFDLALIDIFLPDGNGFEVFEILKEKGMRKEAPVVFLTSSSELESKLMAFNLGADDYLVKPISPLELKARIETKLKKANHAKPDYIVRGELRVELSLLKAFTFKAGVKSEIQLTTTEFKILAYLMQNENTVFSQEELIKDVWGKGVHILPKTVVSHVYGLRKKLGVESAYIENIPNVGYRFRIPYGKIETA